MMLQCNQVLSEFVFRLACVSCLSFQRGVSVEGCRVRDFTVSHNKDEMDVREIVVTVPPMNFVHFVAVCCG